MRKDLILPRMILVGVALLLIAIYLRDIGIIDWNLEKILVILLVIVLILVFLGNFVFCKYED